MNTLWVVLALWIGAMAGFLLFGLMAMARDSERHESRVLVPARRNATRTRSRTAAAISARS
jgi:hypothetical protein